MVKKFISYYKPYRGLFALDMLASLLIAVADLFYPMIARNIINDYVPNRQLRLLIVWLGALLLIYVAKMLLNYFVQYMGHVMGTRMQGDMRRDMFRHLQKLPLSFFDENKTGNIMSRIINDLFDVSELAHHGPENLFLCTVMFVGSFAVMATINIWLTLIVFAMVPVIVLFSLKMRGRMHKAFKESREQIAEVNAEVETSIAGIRVSRAYVSADHENERFDHENGRYVKVRSNSYKAMGQFHSGMGLLSDVLYLIALAAGGLFFYFGKIDSGSFAAFVLYISMVLKPINSLVALIEQLQNGMTGFARFQEVMAVAEESEPENPVQKDTVEGRITFDHVSFRYGNEQSPSDKLIIDDLSIELDSGKTVALVGPSGGGKTTLCHLIPRFYEIESGKISIDGVDIRDFRREDLRKAIGIVAQDVFLFNCSIKENIAYGNPDATDEEIVEAAKKANIHDYIMTLEQGYDTNVGERGIKLSGGQKQRISIARVFLKNPPILILDEATSALDNVTEMLLQQSLEELSKGRTVVVVAHRLSTVKNADEIVVLTADGVEERGTHEQLIEHGGIYATLYNHQFRT
ncbi:MAG: ABC transporter ATP-binding protein [Clostridia bacterium]|nr:ABC transporter ATP-binding protein [Clostridia bacterium]